MFLLESDSGSKLCTSRYLQGMNHYKYPSVFLNIKVALFCQILSKKYEVYIFPRCIILSYIKRNNKTLFPDKNQSFLSQCYYVNQMFLPQFFLEEFVLKEVRYVSVQPSHYICISLYSTVWRPTSTKFVKIKGFVIYLLPTV